MCYNIFMKKDVNNIKVSIVCNTYNQEKYIKKALDSFVMQKTNFLFEVIIHDDCSNDNTKNIILDYQKKYPEIIKPIFEKENQYSKGVDIFNLDIPFCKGKYIAICEGDDFWISENKLQKQYDYMESNSNCHLCIHNAISVDSNTEIKIKDICPVKDDGFVSFEKLVQVGGGFCATNSIFFPKEDYEKAPSFIKEFSCDYMLQIYFSSLGDTYCFNDIMSCYRISSEGSWTQKINKNKNYYINWLKKLIHSLKQFNEYTNHKYDVIEDSVNIREIRLLIYQGKYQLLKNKKYLKYIKKYPLKKKIKVYFCMYFPRLSKILKKMKGSFHNE